MKTKPCIKLGVLLFGVSLFLWNCIEEDFMNPQNTVASKKFTYTLEKMTYQELLADKEIKQSLPLIERRFSNTQQQNTYSRTSTEVADGLTIFTDEINRIVIDDVITWTFQTQSPVLETSDFENFLVKKHNGVFTYFLVSYELADLTDAETLYEKATSYVISEEYLNLDGLNLSSRDAFDWVFPNDGGGTGSGPCDGILVYDQCNLGGNADGHLPALQNDGTYCSGSPLLYIDFSHCENYGVPDSPAGDPIGGDNGSGGDQLIGGGGGGGNSDGDGDTTLTAPIELADPRCPPGSGKVMIDEVCVCPPASNKIEDADGNCVCPEGKVENYQGVCVEDTCRYINLQIQNPNYTQQANELEGKTGLKKETGYKQNKDGTQVALVDTNNGHSLKIPIDGNTTGYMHTHLDDFLTGKIDPKTGEEELLKPIKIFSPADLLKFLQMVKNTKHNGVPMHLVYATMISSSRTYTLRFTGNVDDIVGLGSANSYRADYKEYFTKKFKSNKEKAFLHFIKDKIGINGINLYRIRDNGDVEKKTLKDNGNIDTNDCE
ncbi:MAG: hypothetical protein GKR88_17980 [Flavobacteriaceae bacterium]|nr:MAG: hypothetical protein GKR88_17980 [Flavobacteriaceae bacterium]